MANVRPLPESLQQMAVAELNEVPDRLASDIEALREWINKQPYLKARTDDQFLVAFLRGCKFSMEKAKSKIDKYYTLRTKYPDFFTTRNMDESRILELLSFGVGIPLPNPLNENGPRINLIRPGAYAADRYTFDDVMCMANSMREITLLEDDVASVNGVIDILDFSQVTASHFLQMSPTVMKKMSVYAEEALPIRQRSTHIIHTPSGFEPIFRMIKPVLPAKQQERLQVHGDNMESLYKYIPKKYLPVEYGGENGSIEAQIAESVRIYKEHRQHFADDIKYGVDESLRPGKAVDYDNVFGTDGSFRKINVD